MTDCPLTKARDPTEDSRASHRVPCHGVFQAVGAHAGTHERRQRTAGAERCAEISGERPHVETLAAADTEGEVRWCQGLESDRVHRHLARRALDLDPFTRELVEPAPFVVERRVHGRHLANAADESLERLLDDCGAHRGHRPRLEHRSREILGVGRDAEPHRGQVLLVEVHEVGGELGRLADQDGQDTGGGRIERAAVADLGGAQEPA